jgi:hypothetical protein
MRIWPVIAAASLITSLCVAAAPSAGAIQDGTPGQTEIDGQWAGLEPDGIASRPFVKRLVVTRSGVETVAIDNTGSVPNPEVTGGFGVAISPTNLCAQGQTPAPGQCYATPNRVGITVGFTDSGALHTDFSSALASSKNINVDQSTEFDLTIALNTLGQTLRWTWLQGLPTYWKVTNIGQADATMRVKFKPRLSPVVEVGNVRGGCTQIPVMPTCEFSSATEYHLQAGLVLSLDETLDAAFTGALFATEKAYIGSLNTGYDNSGNPALTWGIAAPTTTGEAENLPRLWAVVSDAALLNYFGVPAEGDPRTLFSVAVDSGSADPETGGWQRWTAGARGTDGWLISTDAVPVATSSAAARTRDVRAQSLAAAAVVYAKAVTVNLKRKSAPPQVMARYSTQSKKTTVSFNGTKALRDKCVQSGFSCRVVVEKITSKTRVTTSGLATVAAATTKATVTANAVTGVNKATRNTRIVVILERKGRTGGWTYLASAGATVTT